jgi:hypothetical protein
MISPLVDETDITSKRQLPDREEGKLTVQNENGERLHPLILKGMQPAPKLLQKS